MNSRKTSTRTQKALLLVLQIAIVMAAEALNAVAYNALIVPARLLESGVVGIALLFNQLFALPIGVQTLLYNIPIFVIGWRYLGRRFFFLSLVGVATFSILVDSIRIPAVTSRLELIAIFGGVLTGIADGIILRTGGSTGGFDIIGMIISKRYGLSVGQVFLVLNSLLIGLGTLATRNLEVAMLTLIMMFVAARVVDVILSPTPRRMMTIVSTKHAEIAERILKDLGRGVTYLQGSGAYTSRDFTVIMVVVTRYESVELRRILREIDSNAFASIVAADEVIGHFERRSPFSKFLK